MSTYYKQRQQAVYLKILFSSISIILIKVLKVIDPDFPKSSYSARGTVCFPSPSSFCQEEVSLEHVAYDDSLVADGGSLFFHVCPGPPESFSVNHDNIQCIKCLPYMI